MIVDLEGYSLKQRIITGLLITSVVLPTFLYGGWPFNIVVFLFIASGLYEAYAIRKDQWPLWIYLGMILLVIFYSQANLETLFVAFILLLMGLYLMTVLFEWFTPQDVNYIFTMSVLLTTAMRAVLLTVSYGRIELVYLLVVTYLTDSGAYFAGYFFGKHKLNERISPKKTVEGAIGGWLVAFVLGSVYAYFLIDKLPLNFMILSSALLPLVSQLGDLAFSAIKRSIGIKDFGTIFPAHGGVLDRIDSLLFSLMTFYVMITLLIQ